MSQLIGDAALVVLSPPDFRSADGYWRSGDVIPGLIQYPTWGDDDASRGYASLWWGRGSHDIGGALGGPEGIMMTGPSRPVWAGRGASSRLGFANFTRDAAGQILPGATVRLFRTSTDELVAKVISGADGFYVATTPYADAHYLTVHRTGAPSLAGASVDTLLPG